MIEITFEEATVESMEDAAVVMAVGVGDKHMSNVLVGRKEFVRVAANPALVAETKIVRVKVEGEEQLEELKRRVMEATGRLDPDVKIAEVKVVEVKAAEVKAAEVKTAEVKTAAGKATEGKKPAARKAKPKPEPEPEVENAEDDE